MERKEKEEKERKEKQEKEKEGEDGVIIGRQVITQMIFCPAFDEDLFAGGTHLFQQYDYKMGLVNKPDMEKFKDHHHIRYHYLRTDIPDAMPSLIIDFKQYFTLPALFILKYLCGKQLPFYKLEHLSYTSLADRFAHYLQRVAIP